MRKYLLTAALLAGCAAAGSLLPGNAAAMTISTPAALAKAVDNSNVSEVRYVCRRVWSRWGWRRSCFWRPGYAYYGYPPYGYYRYGYPYRHHYYRRYGYRYY
jgi:hypothetical protein